MTGKMQSSGLQLTLRDITKQYGPTTALEGLDLEIIGGRCLALVGENGAGKSTLLKIISGQTRPDRGEMQLSGEAFRPTGPRDALRRGVAIVHQELCLAPHLSVEANIMLGREPNRLGWRSAGKCDRKAREILAELDYADLNLRTPVGKLGPGVRQIVEIGRALASDARILLLDEPTSSLTEADSERLFQVMDRLKKRGLAIVFISHALEEVNRVADSIAVLRDGRLVRVAPKPDWDERSIISAMVGRAIEDLYPEKTGIGGESLKLKEHKNEIAMELDSISGKTLPRRVSLKVARGRVLGIAGLIGSGRTETARVAMGLASQGGGTLKLVGRTVAAKKSTRWRIQHGLGLLSEDRAGEGLALARTIEENILYSTMGRSARFGFIKAAAARRRANDWVKRLGVKCHSIKQPVRRLSGGNQQKVALARLFEQQGDILILDEPTRGVDVGAKVEIYKLVRQQAAEGRALVVISSYLPELMGVCDDLAVMHEGELSPIRPVGEWTQEEVMHWATAGGRHAEALDQAFQPKPAQEAKR